MAKISKNIKKFRTEKKLTQEALGDMIGVSRQTVSSWETDRTQPDIDMIELLSSAFEVSVEELIYGKKNHVGLEAQNKPNRNIFFIVLTVLGTLFTVSGLIIIFTVFWEELKFAKNIFAFLPFAAGVGVACFAMLKRKDNVIWREAAAVAWTVGVAATNALINSVNNINFGFCPLMLFDVFLVLPVIFVTKGIFPTVACLYAITHSCIFLRSEYGLPEFFIYTAAVVIILSVIGIFIKKHKRNDIGDIINFWAFYLAVGVNICSSAYCLEDQLGQAGSLTAFLFAVMAFSVLSFVFGEKISARPVKRFSAVVIAAVSLLVSLADILDLSTERSFIELCLLILPFAAAVVAFVFEIKKKDIVDIIMIGAFILQFSAAFLFDFTGAGESPMFLTVIFSVCIGICIIIKGVAKAELLTANFGMLNIIIAVWGIQTALYLSTLTIGITVAVTGIVLLAVNKILIKHFRKYEEEKENA